MKMVHEYTTPIRIGAVAYTAQTWGDPRDDGMWEGWLEFVPDDGGPILRTKRETAQSTLGALTYWATGIEAVYLEGAAKRALDQTRVA